MNNNNLYRLHETFYEKQISDRKKIVVHLISFGDKKPVLAIQSMWRENTTKDWNPGKMSVMTKDILIEMLKSNILTSALKTIESLENK